MPPRPSSRRRGPGPVRLTRRAGLGGLAGAAGAGLLLAGCTDGSSDTPPDGVLTPTGPPDDADDDLAATVAEKIAATRDDVVALGRAVPAVRSDARALARLHEAHGRELGGLRAPRRRAARGRPSEGEARARIDRAERRLAAVLVDASVDAGSGALAQLFASMSAALAQRAAS